ncbi:NAD(P)/FAD-dependent oxidoreductase [Acinetobacter pittii]|uniref:NAD(P)/FAD-dependent oxidoreductase n=1 Tax=Acinetobacter pittii TaxID=48296 RepID=UPI001902B5E6|nr:NAD(P)/FAD-dependent oxidoreductase [Acinetobacter pittii]MBJ8478152.1 NAD(P)/FAD-dependent oxidoreductase [Acinetobacter pittii]MBN6512585.1 NAD(P)/FAD-dependent oxidoreductase [Acinetobacter pittii]MCU4340272.1 NAD(P)/FAD-dependent oxidoreductase [Acinetobacter pittii]MCU4559615.1 NAD(P)/FAD-dependent oxidoreductase [Acinetobacter pittii]
MNKMLYDVAIIGGSYAGLSAAMPLARARRNIAIIDAGQRRNRFAEYSHGFLTQDGTQANEIVEIAKKQLEVYSTVEWQNGRVKKIAKIDEGFCICIDGVYSIQTKKIIIAAGVSDQLPEIAGLAERWGKTVFHCPYCHGYELEKGKIGILATSEHSLQLAMMLPDWGPTTLLLNGNDQLIHTEWHISLQKRGVIVEPCLIQEIRGEAEIVFTDGKVIALDGLFIPTRTYITQPWLAELGCEVEDTPFGQIIKTNATKDTTVKGVFACGDIARLGGSVPFAVADGMMAGVSAHRSLILNGSS